MKAWAVIFGLGVMCVLAACGESESSFAPNGALGDSAGSPSADAPRNSVNNSIRRGGQARNIVIDARGSGLWEVDAIAGLARLRGISSGRLDYVSVIGDDFFRGTGFGS